MLTPERLAKARDLSSTARAVISASLSVTVERLEDIIELTVQFEREQCAKLADKLGAIYAESGGYLSFAKALRARE